MNVDEAIREAVEAALREALPAIREELGRPRMIPIKDAPVAYRAILDAEKRGELRIYRVGHASLVDESELFAWIRRAGSGPRLRKVETCPSDEVGEIVALNDDRRRARKRG